MLFLFSLYHFHSIPPKFLFFCSCTY
jgi:hypothetical protein